MDHIPVLNCRMQDVEEGGIESLFAFFSCTACPTMHNIGFTQSISFRAPDQGCTCCRLDALSPSKDPARERVSAIVVPCIVPPLGFGWPHELAFGNFRDLRPIPPHFTHSFPLGVTGHVHQQSLTSPKATPFLQCSKFPFLSKFRPTSTPDADHAHAMQVDLEARRSESPDAVRHDQCSPCRKISNYDPLRPRC